MNNLNSEQPDMEDNEMLPEYDFTHGVTIHQADGTSVIQQFTLEDGAVMLDSDVREYFPDAEAVNQALRTLISLFPKNRESIKLQ